MPAPEWHLALSGSRFVGVNGLRLRSPNWIEIGRLTSPHGQHSFQPQNSTREDRDEAQRRPNLDQSRRKLTSATGAADPEPAEAVRADHRRSTTFGPGNGIGPWRSP